GRALRGDRAARQGQGERRTAREAVPERLRGARRSPGGDRRGPLRHRRQGQLRRSMSPTIFDAAALAGRVLMAAIFLHEAYAKLTGCSAAAAYMQAFGVPGQLLPLAIAAELGGGVLILLGYHARAAALVLAGFCLLTAALFHAKLGNRNELLHFEKDLAIAG